MSSTMVFFLFVPLLVIILLSVNLTFAPHNPYMEKNSVFECGFSSFLGQNRTQFSISFFIFALLFLLFDLEILLVYPYLVSAYTNGVYGLVIMLMFLLALTLGFAFELGKKALSIDSRQISTASANSKHKGVPKVDTYNKDKSVYKINTLVSPSYKITRRHYCSLTRISSMYSNMINPIFYVWLRQLMFALSLCLVLILGLQAIYLFACFLGLTSFTLSSFTLLLFVLSITCHVDHYYSIIKSKISVTSDTNIKPYSYLENLKEFIISLGQALVELTGLYKKAMLLINIVLYPVQFLLILVPSSIKNAVFSMLDSIYQDYKISFQKRGIYFVLDLLVSRIHNFIKCNVLYLLYYFLLFMYCVYLGFISLSFFLLNIFAIVIFLSIVYMCKHRSLFKNDIEFFKWLIVLLILLGIVLYWGYNYIAGACLVLAKNGSGEGPEGPSGPSGSPGEQGGPGGPKGPRGSGEYVSPYAEDKDRERKGKKPPTLNEAPLSPAQKELLEITPFNHKLWDSAQDQAQEEANGDLPGNPYEDQPTRDYPPRVYPHNSYEDQPTRVDLSKGDQIKPKELTKEEIIKSNRQKARDARRLKEDREIKQGIRPPRKTEEEKLERNRQERIVRRRIKAAEILEGDNLFNPDNSNPFNPDNNNPHNNNNPNVNSYSNLNPNNHNPNSNTYNSNNNPNNNNVNP